MTVDPDLVGRLVALERLALDRHAEGLWDAIGRDPALWERIPFGPFPDPAAFTAYLAERVDKPDRQLYAVRRLDSDVVAGLLLLWSTDAASGSAEMGLVHGPSLARNAAGTEAFLLLGSEVFGTRGWRRLEWRCDTANTASMRGAAWRGFTLDGVLRQNARFKDQTRDTAVFSILADEWPGIRDRIRKRIGLADH